MPTLRRSTRARVEEAEKERQRVEQACTNPIGPCPPLACLTALSVRQRFRDSVKYDGTYACRSDQSQNDEKWKSSY